MSIDDILKNPRAFTTERYWREEDPDEYAKITLCKGVKFAEKLYNYYYNTDNKCIECSNPTQFMSFTKGYRKYCCKRCAYTNAERNNNIGVANLLKKDVALAKRKETNLKKFGTETPQALYDIKQKTKQTCIERYGTTSPLNNDVIKQKTKQTCIERYGTELPGISEKSRTKASQTKLEKYGTKGYNNREKAKQTCVMKYGLEWYNNRVKAKQTCMERYGAATWAQSQIKYGDVIGFTEDGLMIMKCPHPECKKCTERQYTTTSQLHRDRGKHGSELCTILHPMQKSHSTNTTGEIFVHLILDEHNIKYIKNDRSLGFEIDIYIPSLKIGIEVNGYRWHSDKYKVKKYHLNKFLECQNKDIQLIQIWEDWIIHKPDIVKSIILSKIGIYKKRLGARQCKIMEVDKQEAEQFIKQNHIQGSCHASIKLGLYHNDELVSIMTFGKKRPGIGVSENSWELLRFCCKQGYQIMGGASKILHEFKRIYNPDKIISFSSNDISTGSLYKNLGFKECGTTLSYWYISGKNASRYHRFTFTKQTILKRGLCNDRSLTEVEMMYDAGFYRIWDSGTKKWEL